jgi:hypothetical protein
VKLHHMIGDGKMTVVSGASSLWPLTTKRVPDILFFLPSIEDGRPLSAHVALSRQRSSGEWRVAALRLASGLEGGSSMVHHGLKFCKHCCSGKGNRSSATGYLHAVVVVPAVGDGRFNRHGIRGSPLFDGSSPFRWQGLCKHSFSLFLFHKKQKTNKKVFIAMLSVWWHGIRDPSIYVEAPRGSTGLHFATGTSCGGSTSLVALRERTSCTSVTTRYW